MSKVTAKSLSEIVHCSQVSRKRNGNFLFRNGYFYTNGATENTFAIRIINALAANNIDCTVVDMYNHWAPFRGGAKVANQSHFGVEIKILENN